MTVGYQLSPLQRRLLAQAGDAMPAFQTTIAWHGPVPGDEFRAAMEQVCLRHEILCSSFVTPSGAALPLQVPGAKPAIGAAAGRIDVASLPLVAVASAADGGGWRHEVTFSALVADAGCLGLLHRDLLRELRGEAGEEPPCYSMMAQWLEELPGSADGEVLAARWREAAGPGPWMAERAEGTGGPAFTGLALDVSEADLLALRELAGRCGAELRDGLAGLWALVLSQSLAEPSVTLGWYAGGRLDSDLAGLMGPLGRYLPLRAGIDPGMTVADLLAEIRSARVDGEPHAEGYQLPAASYLSAGFDYIALPGAAGDRLRMVHAMTRSDLTGVRLSCVDGPAGSSLRLDVLAGDALAERLDPGLLAGRVRAALARLASAAPADRLTVIDALPPDQAAAAVLRGPASRAPGGAARPTEHSSLLSMFDEQAGLAPGQPAVCDGDASLTYAELDALADRYADAIARSAAAGDRVLLSLGRGAGFRAGLLGAWRLGAVPVPVDPRLPAERRRHIQRSSGAACVIDAQTALPARGSGAYRGRSPGAADPAYCIFTSGSTGEPAGVLVSHGPLAAHCAGLARRLGIGPADRIALTAAAGFDVVLEQACLPWTAGAASCAQRLATPTLDELTGFVRQARVTVLNLTPSLWRALGEHWRASGPPPGQVRALILGAEVLRAQDVALAAEVLPSATVFNAYGPTEAVITATIGEVAADGGEPAIGAPLPGRWVAVLDHRGLPVPRGTVGQLAIGGECLADGYLNDPGLAAARFVRAAWPDGPLAGTRMLLTGDYAVLAADGRLRFRGRRDRQVKIRGQRVELDEIERALAGCPGVREAAVVADEDGRLIAAVTPAGAEAAALRAEVAGRIPHYMIPQQIRAVSELPRLANGKVDYRRLGTWQVTAATAAGEPSTDTERLVAALWQEILGTGSVGRDSDFFELGGQSLKAIIVTTRLRPEYGEQVKVATLFANSRLRDFAAELDRIRAAARPPEPVSARPAEVSYAYQASHAQQRLWFLGQFIADGAAYNAPAALIAPRRLSLAETAAAWERLAAHHDALRTTFAEQDGVVTAVVGERSQVRVRFVDLSGATAPEEAFTRACRQEMGTEFDLERGPVGRVTLFWMPAGTSRCFVNLHHIATDLWSTRILLRDFVACVSGGEPVSSRARSYRDYADLERRMAVTGAWDEYEQYLRGELDPPPRPLELPCDFARPELQDYRGRDLTFELDHGTKAAVESFANERGLTPFMVFMTAYLIMLRRLTNQDDIIVGFPVAGRDRPEFHDVVGFFVGTSFVRVNFAATRTAGQLLAEVKRKVVRAMGAQEYPFDRLVSKARLPRSVSHSPVFTTMLAHQDLPPLAPELVAENWRIAELPDPVSKFDLGLTTWFDGEAARASLGYSTALFRAESAAAFAQKFRQCLARLLEA